MYTASELLDAIGNSVDDGFYTLDLEGNVEYLNGAAERTLGWSSEAIRGKNAHETFHHVTPEGTPIPTQDCPLLEVMASGYAYVGEVTLMTRAGDFLPVICSAVPIHNGNSVVGGGFAFRPMASGRATRVSGAATSVLGFLADTSFDAIVTMDQTGIIRHWNNAAMAMFGYNRTELVGRSAAEFLSTLDSNADPQLALATLLESAAPRRSQVIEARGRHRDGESIPIEISLAVTDKTPDRGRVVVFVRDIRARIRAERLQAAQHTFLRILNESASYDSAAPAVLHSIAEMLGCPVAQMWRFNPERRLFGHGWHQPTAELDAFELASRELVKSAGAGVVGAVNTTGEPIWVGDLSIRPQFLLANAASAAGLNAAIVFPLRAGADVVGVIECFAPELAEPDALLLDALGNIGAHLGQFIVRAQQSEALERTYDERRNLLRQLITAQEAERKRIAGDLHDDAVQVMAAVSMRLSLLRDRLPNPEDQQMVAKLRETVGLTIDRLRALLFELNPPSLNRHGFVIALRMRLDELRDETGCQYELLGDFVTRPSDEIAVLLYRMTQEVCTNIRKHAQASRVTVEIAERDAGYEVTIADDGCGYAVDEVAPVAGHLGLIALRERASLAGGEVAIVSTPGTGTKIRFWVPSGLRGATAADLSTASAMTSETTQ